VAEAARLLRLGETDHVVPAKAREEVLVALALVASKVPFRVGRAQRRGEMLLNGHGKVRFVLINNNGEVDETIPYAL